MAHNWITQCRIKGSYWLLKKHRSDDGGGRGFELPDLPLVLPLIYIFGSYRTLFSVTYNWSIPDSFIWWKLLEIIWIYLFCDAKSKAYRIWSTDPPFMWYFVYFLWVRDCWNLENLLACLSETVPVVKNIPRECTVPYENLMSVLEVCFTDSTFEIFDRSS